MKSHIAPLLVAWTLNLAAHANAAELAIVDFSACQSKAIACYQDIAEIRREQLASERERLFVAVERAQLDDYEQAREHRSYALWGQYFQGWILLLIGIGIVVVGLWMSWQQLRDGFRDGANLDNAFELGKDGLRLSSPVVGLFIFGASIWFFNTYIDKVYTLNLLREDSAAATPSPTKEPANATDTQVKPGVTP